MNQPQQLHVSCDFQGYLVCQIPKDVMDVELKTKTKWGKFTLHTDQHTRTDKYRPWQKVGHHRIHARRRPSSHNITSRPHLNCSTDSDTFINSGPGLGYPPKTFIDSNTDNDLPLHIPNLEDYCRMCLTKRVRCTCKPMSDWNGELIDITQPDPPNPNNNAINDREDRQDQALPSDCSDQDNFWLGRTYDKVRPLSSLKPVPVLTLQKEMRTANGASIFTHTITGLRLLCKFSPPNLLQTGPKVSGLPQLHFRHPPQKTPKTQTI